MSRSPPLRFLILLLAGWSAIRAALLAPGWWASAADAGGRPPVAAASEPRQAAAPRQPGPAPPLPRIRQSVRSPDVRRPRTVPAAVTVKAAEAATPERPLLTTVAWALPPSAGDGRPAGPAGIAPDPARAAPPSRWSFTAWSFLRSGEAAPLAAGGMLGGSQAGARLAYRLNGDPARPLALGARLTAPVRRPAGAEAAFGIDWQPSRRLPLHLLAERRQRLGREGRSAFGVTLYGGVSEAPLRRLRVDAYAQAGLVGARSRDPFADGALRVSLPLGRARLGAGAWAAAQPGVARFDVGPQASLRLPLAGRTVTVAADWRQRLAGNARPGSGPTLTLATDF